MADAPRDWCELPEAAGAAIAELLEHVEGQPGALVVLLLDVCPVHATGAWHVHVVRATALDGAPTARLLAEAGAALLEAAPLYAAPAPPAGH